jgi:hypothetical protein
VIKNPLKVDILLKKAHEDRYSPRPYMKREAGGQDFRVNFRVNFRSAWRPAGMSRHNQQRSFLKKAARSWEAPMR